MSHPDSKASAGYRIEPGVGISDDALRDFAPALLDSLVDAIAVVDVGQRVVAANRRYVEAFGTRAGARTGAHCADVLRCPEHGAGAGVMCPACRARDEGRPQRVVRALPDASGVTRRWEGTFTPILNEAGVVSHVVEVWRDVTDRTSLEAQVAHGERLAAVGMLAAGISHEINNPLASIMAGVEALQRLTARGECDAEHCGEVLEIADILQREVTRCSDTTSKLMLLVQPSSASPAWTDLNRAVEDTVELLSYQMRRQQIEWRPDVDLALPRIWGRESELRGVCMNLMLNAVQAMPAGGVLTVRTRPVGKLAQLEVEDTGSGITPQDLSRIWDPFFTTKPPGKGTGLGLFVCHGIVSRHGGSIRGENRAEGGARFVVELPFKGSGGEAT
ncbi:MAG TPA: ATP-binding protein [Candidatus Saccharimonadaceae bacterium]|nr:ATP-binding protein [Candidatus Saccharimonadaceae bacterium]